MQKQNQQQSETSSLLNEILMSPSQQTVANRFETAADSNSAANCTGQCREGSCISFV